jgi:hypothetical protein
MTLEANKKAIVSMGVLPGLDRVVDNVTLRWDDFSTSHF